MKKSRRKYDADFKRQAVRMVTVDGRSCRAVEQDLGIAPGILYRWVRAVGADPQECFPGNGRLKPSIGDVARLQRELELVRRERDVLKKALGIFSRMPVRSTNSSLSMQRS